MARSCVIIGSGRAGGAFHDALTEVGWTSRLVAARTLLTGAADSPATSGSDRVSGLGEFSAERGVDLPDGFDTMDLDLVLLTVPDTAIAEVARALPEVDAVVAHVSGACALDVLAPHGRVGSIHPLMSLPDAATGRRRLLDACTFAVDGDQLMRDVVESLGGLAIDVPASSRALYHATAAIAANHLTALCAQVESLAEAVGVPAEAYWTMMRTTLDNVADTGPAAALTGPAARADWDTIRAHLDALPTDHDVALYRSLCEASARLAGHDLPTWWHAR